RQVYENPGTGVRNRSERVYGFVRNPQPGAVAAPPVMARRPLTSAAPTSTRTAPDPGEEVRSNERFDPARRRARRGGLGRLAIHGPAHLAGGPVPVTRVPTRRNQQRPGHPPRRSTHRPGPDRPLTSPLPKEVVPSCQTPPRPA